MGVLFIRFGLKETLKYWLGRLTSPLNQDEKLRSIENRNSRKLWCVNTSNQMAVWHVMSCYCWRFYALEIGDCHVVSKEIYRFQGGDFLWYDLVTQWQRILGRYVWLAYRFLCVLVSNGVWGVVHDLRTAMVSPCARNAPSSDRHITVSYCIVTQCWLIKRTRFKSASNPVL